MNSNPEIARAAQVWQAWAHKILTTQIRDGSVDDGAFDEHRTGWYDGRYAALVIPRLVAVRLWSDRIDGDHSQIEAAARRAMDFVLRRQRADGQLDLGCVCSPNEAGFPVPALARAYRGLLTLNTDWARDLAAGIRQYMLRAAEALIAGEAYTANHRWAAIAGPLAAIHTLFPDERYVRKIQNYLADGIDCDADGCWFEERSVGYSNVANHGMFVLADNLKDPSFLAYVVRNVQFMLHQIQPNGEADTSFSFRQDRACANCAPVSYAIARRAAQISGDGRLTTLAQRVGISEPTGSDLMPLLFELDDHPEPLPAPAPLPETYERFFPGIQVLRRRWANNALALQADAGHHFFDTIRDHWGGVRRSEDWFQLHHGEVVIASIQVAIAGMRHVQPQCLVPKEPGHYLITGRGENWWHTAHFRPLSPTFEMHGEVASTFDVIARDDAIDLHLEVHTPHSLAATLKIWVRAGVHIQVGDASSRPLVAGETVLLSRGLPVLLTKNDATIEIHGLPPAAHSLSLNYDPSIPSAIPSTCACLHVGLRLPVLLDLHLRLR